MKRLTFSLAMVLMPGALWLAPHARGADAKSISTQDIKAAYEKGDYAETLSLVNRVLLLKGKAAEAYDRLELLMLRADTQLRLRQQTAALKTLEEAQKVAKTTKDESGLAGARALALLIKKSKALQYTPKVATGKGAEAGAASAPIDITDPKHRKEAFEGLYADEKLAAKSKVQDADKAKFLVPIATALKAVVPLKDLELAATGKDTETSETIKSLVDRTHKLMAKSLDDMTKRTEKIATKADELIEYTIQTRTGGTETRTRRRGIDKDASRELAEIIDTSKKIVQSCKDLTEGFTDDSEPFDDLVDIAKDLTERANDVLKDNYGRK
jgi:hypothetical protein